ncbi:MAG: MATE family efflux transporter [Tenericutes bacterium]|nr:MATE family efflux transporter [Mycoplasmatota bacterium]
MDDKRIHLLKNEKVSKAVNKMATPAIIGMIVMAIYNVVDSIFVSWISEEGYEVAATQVVFPIMLIASSIGLALGMGGGSYISRLLGKNNKIEANKVATVSFFTGIILGLILTTVNLFFLEPILNLFGADVNTLDLAKEYGSYIIFGYAFTILNMILNNILRSEGSAKYSMIGMAIGSVLNIILDPIFIFVFGWGIAGAAIATMLSQFVSSAILLSIFIRGKSLIKIAPKNFKPSVAIYKEILKVGIPTFFRQVLVSVAIGILNNAASDVSTDLVTAIGIITRVSMIPMYFVFGFCQGFQPVAGYNFGAGNKQRVKDSFRYALKVSLGIVIIASIFFLLFSDVIFIIYNSSESVTNYGMIGFRYYAIGMLFMGISNPIAVFYQSLGRGVEALILSVSRQGLFFIPLILILPGIFGVDGVLISQALGDFLTALLSIAVIAPFFINKKLDVLMTH